jgi:hypothetical protein
MATKNKEIKGPNGFERLLKYYMKLSFTQFIEQWVWHAPKLLVRLEMGLRMPNNEIVWKLGARSQLSALEGVEGRAEASGLD